MSNEQIKNEVLDYLDFLCLGMEMLEQLNSFQNIQEIDKRVNEYERELEEKYSPVLKRKI